MNGLRLQRHARGVASAASEGTAGANAETKAGPVDGPLREYDVRVEEGRLRDDPYQRGECLLRSLWSPHDSK